MIAATKAGTELIGTIVIVKTKDDDRLVTVSRVRRGKGGIEIAARDDPNVFFGYMPNNPAQPAQPGTWHHAYDDYTIERDDMDEAADKGRILGEAFAKLTSSGGTDLEAIMTLAERFSVLEGYSDIRRGMEYIRGFAAGFQQAKQAGLLEAPSPKRSHQE